MLSENKHLEVPTATGILHSRAVEHGRRTQNMKDRQQNIDIYPLVHLCIGSCHGDSNSYYTHLSVFRA